MKYERVICFEDLFKLGMDREVPKILPDFLCGDGVNTVVNIGCGNKIIPGATNLDYPEYDFDFCAIPFDNESVDQIHAYHFLEHLKDPVRILLEFQRVLKFGCHANIVVPYYTSQMQAHDLDHKSQFCEETWRNLFSTKYYNKNRINWKLSVNFNMICGIVERNLCLVTQLVKTK